MFLVSLFPFLWLYASDKQGGGEAVDTNPPSFGFFCYLILSGRFYLAIVHFSNRLFISERISCELCENRLKDIREIYWQVRCGVRINMSYQKKKNENFMLEREVQYTYHLFSKSYFLFSCQVQKLLFDWQTKKYSEKMKKHLHVGWRHWLQQTPLNMHPMILT